MLTFIVSISFAQQYTPMTAAGYQYKRTKTDSTMHLPSFCGVPNLRNSTAIQGALAMDTCNNKLYKWTRAAGWSEVSGAVLDTTNRFVNNVTKVNDSTIRVWKGASSTDLLIRGNASGGSGTTPNLQQVTDVSPVGTTTNTLIVDDGIVHTTKLGFTDYGANLVYPLRYTNIFNGAIDIIDSMNTYPPVIFGYNTVSTNPSYKIGFTGYNDKPLIDFIGLNSKLKITSQLISFSDNGGDVTTLQTIPNGSTETHYLPVNNGVDDTLVSQSPNDGQYYAYKDGNWAPFTPGGGGGQNGRFGNDTATVVMAKVHNNSGTTLTNGKVVYLATSGTNSDAPSVRLANSKNDSTSANTFGFVSGSIAVNDTGWIILSGKIEKLNTSAYSNGDIIYLDTISGNYTNIKPQAPTHLVYLGVIIKSNAGNGSIFVKCQNGYELNEIHDVQINGKLNNQVLAYSDTQKVWKNRNIYSIVDTTIFQRKSISANTIMANNTASAGNATAQTYVDAAEQTMSNTITWTGTAPTSLTSANYTWQQIGKTVTMQFNALYANAGVSNTGYFFTLPSDMPAPAVPTGWTGASGYLYTGTASTHNTAATINSNVAISYIRRNAANTAFEVGFIGTGVSARGFKLSITYKAQ